MRDALRAALGAEVPFEFRADPALIAGLELHGPQRHHAQSSGAKISIESARSLGVTNIPLDLDSWLTDARERVRAATLAPAAEQIGRVEAVADGIATVSGLAGVRVNELVRFQHRQVGFALTLDENSIGCVLLDDIEGVEAGHRVTGTGEIVRVPVGPGLLGRTVDPLGRALDAGGTIDAEGFEPVERPAPAIIERDFVTEPVQTGLLVIDSMFALGRGQRELIIGDRAIGKTAIAVDCIINQKTSDMICVYVAVGQKSSTVKRVIDAIHRHGAPERCIFVVAGPRLLRACNGSRRFPPSRWRNISVTAEGMRWS